MNLAKRLLTVAVAVIGMAGLAGGVASAAPGHAAAQLSSLSFATSSDWHAGDCTVFRGATWTLNSDGTASFDGVATSSDDNDAWLMWVQLWDTNNNLIGRIANVNPPDDPYEFVQNMPSHEIRYRWLASGRFPANWYPLIGRMTLSGRC